jgi:hypothetical protein
MRGEHRRGEEDGKDKDKNYTLMMKIQNIQTAEKKRRKEKRKAREGEITG